MPGLITRFTYLGNLDTSGKVNPVLQNHLAHVMGITDQQPWRLDVSSNASCDKHLLHLNMM